MKSDMKPIDKWRLMQNMTSVDISEIKITRREHIGAKLIKADKGILYVKKLRKKGRVIPAPLIVKTLPSGGYGLIFGVRQLIALKLKNESVATVIITRKNPRQLAKEFEKFDDSIPNEEKKETPSKKTSKDKPKKKATKSSTKKKTTKEKVTKANKKAVDK